MEKQLGKEYKDATQREAFLKDNCDAMENKGYMKQFTPEQLQEHKENLANVSIKISEVEIQKKESDAYFNGELKPLKETRAKLVSDIRSKAKFVEEDCYKFVDQENRMTGFYNSEGDLIECRPATTDELQPRLFSMKTGTDNTNY